MVKQPQHKTPLKKKLGAFELQALYTQHKSSPVFVSDSAGECQVESWLLALRYQQALLIASWIIDNLDETQFRECWRQTLKPEPEIEAEEPSSPPNTATFGGYRLRRRAALHKHRGAPSKKNRRW